MTPSDQTPGERPNLDALFAQAVGDHGAGRLDAAAAAYRKLLALRPDIAEVHSNLGMLLWHQGQLGPALESREAAGHQTRVGRHLSPPARGTEEPEPAGRGHGTGTPLLAAAHVKLGISLRQQERFDEAAAQFEQAVTSMPRDAECCTTTWA